MPLNRSLRKGLSPEGRPYSYCPAAASFEDESGRNLTTEFVVARQARLLVARQDDVGTLHPIEDMNRSGNES